MLTDIRTYILFPVVYDIFSVCVSRPLCCIASVTCGTFSNSYCFIITSCNSSTTPSSKCVSWLCRIVKCKCIFNCICCRITLSIWKNTAIKVISNAIIMYPEYTVYCCTIKTYCRICTAGILITGIILSQCLISSQVTTIYFNAIIYLPGYSS